MKLKVLGSSSKGNCYLLTSSTGETLLVEAGIDFKEVRKALDFKISNVVGCLITHEHSDHAMEVKTFTDRGFNVYMSLGTATALEDKIVNKRRIKVVCNFYKYQIGDFEVIPFDVAHDAAEPIGFIITHKECGTILFATDTYYIPHDFKDLDINHVLIECNFDKEIMETKDYLNTLKDRIQKTHMELEDVKEFFKFNSFEDLKNVVLLHLSNTNSNEEKFKNTFENLLPLSNVYIADIGLEVNLDLYQF